MLALAIMIHLCTTETLACRIFCKLHLESLNVSLNIHVSEIFAVKSVVSFGREVTNVGGLYHWELELLLTETKLYCSEVLFSAACLSTASN